MRIAICEDIKEEAEDLAKKVNTILKEENHDCQIDIFTDPGQFERSGRAYELVFLDCDLPEKNGLEVAKDLRTSNKNTVIIFVTAYDDYVYDSFEVNAFRYLLKDSKNGGIEYDVLKKALKSFVENYEAEKIFTKKSDNKILVLDLKTIIYIESAGKNSIVITLDKSYEIAESISALQAKIRSSGFFRTHRRFIVNMKYIAEVDHYTIVFTNGQHALISRNNAQTFNKVYMNYLKYM